MKWVLYFLLGVAFCFVLLLILIVSLLIYFMSVETYETFGLIGFLIPVGIITIPTMFGWCLWKLIK